MIDMRGQLESVVSWRLQTIDTPGCELRPFVSPIEFLRTTISKIDPQ